ncbi:hypothetical protein B0F90DRAFT_1816688 [Multifurca ochricompacta]|uniref:G-patch domain-containing protein n=1 Tax=Multifurca ochricompacta TaxID=376703 RepID=A0AAD4QLE3_9AGAM|nr:hypothetical protein B0F90DRAFT_1816688 [Multifurca ochricompacta]
MADGDDDYLSDKFLLTSVEPRKPKTYSEKRKEALQKSHLKNQQNRIKGRRQLELESREEGLSKSLFERVEDDKASGRVSEHKGLSMMMKMGFKPGQALGPSADTDEGSPSSSTPPPSSTLTRTTPPQHIIGSSQETLSAEPEDQERHLLNPLPLNEWSGKKGIGLGKRAPSPTGFERLAKVAKAAEDRTRSLSGTGRAQTCATLDERMGKEFNVLWLDPTNPESFPAGFLDVLVETSAPAQLGDSSMEERLRVQMQFDALEPLDDGDDFPNKADSKNTPLAPETIDEAAQFLRLNPVERLSRVLYYLRTEYHYCFWCGTEYKSSDELEEDCPGPDEDMHE